MTQQRIEKALDVAFHDLGPVAQREQSERYRMGKTLEFIESYAGSYQGKRVLELGSSLGIHLIAAQELGASSVTGVDHFIFPEAGENMFLLTQDDVSGLQRAWQTRGISVIDQHLGVALPVPDGSVDLVVCNAVIEHLHGIHQELFREAYRVLAPGGSFVITTPNVASFLKRLRMVFGKAPTWDLKDYFSSGRQFTGHVREFTVDECRSMLEWTGFKTVKAFSRPGYFRWSWAKDPKKIMNILFQGISFLSSRWGDLVFAAGRK